MKSIQMNFTFKKDTKSCAVFETGEKPNFMTLYLKKSQLQDAGIDPMKGVTVTVAQKED